MSSDPIHRPMTPRPVAFDADAGHELAPSPYATGLTVAQYAQLQALVAHVLATTMVVQRDRQRPVAHDRRADQSPLAEPGVWIVLVMLILVALVAIVALAAVFGLSLIGA